MFEIYEVLGFEFFEHNSKFYIKNIEKMIDENGMKMVLDVIDLCEVSNSVFLT